MKPLLQDRVAEVTDRGHLHQLHPQHYLRTSKDDVMQACFAGLATVGVGGKTVADTFFSTLVAS